MEFLLLLLANMAAVTYGQNHFNLFSSFGVSAYSSTMTPGTQPVAGPPIPNKITKGIDFGSTEGQTVSEITNDGATFAEIAGRLQKYDQIAFSVYFNILKLRKNQVYFPFFSMSSVDGNKIFFSVGMEMRKKCTLVEGRPTDCKNKGSVNIRRSIRGQNRKTSLPKSTEKQITFKLGTWTSLIVKIDGAKVEVYINCKLVASGKMDGSFKDNAFPYEGIMRLSQMKLPTGRGQSHQQFMGSMYKPQIMFGKRSFDWYNPCTRDNSISPLKPEPKWWQYDGKKFRKFQDMNSEEQIRVKIWCYDEDGVARRNNGNQWYKKDDVFKCYPYKCSDGKIVVDSNCFPCTDPYDDTKTYQAGQTWIDKNDKCKRWICKAKKGMDTDRISEKIVCPDLNCLPEDQYQPKGACCKKCRQDDCTQNRVWGLGCEKSCDYAVKKEGVIGAIEECATKKKACWCPKGHALNLDGNNCIRTSACGCKVYTGNFDGRKTYKRYKPGQSIRRSLCEMCICRHGKLNCSQQC